MTARYERALALASEGEPAEAVDLLRGVIAEAPGFLDAYEVLGVALDKLGRIDEGIDVLTRMVEIDPRAKMGWVNLSRLYVQKGLIDEAERAKAQATIAAMREGAAASHAPPAARLADIEAPPVPDGPTAPAPVDVERLRLFEAALVEDPDNDIARFALGQMYAQLGRPDRVVEHLGRLVDLRPDWSAAYLALGEAYAHLGQLPEARATWERGVAVADARGDLAPRNKMRARLKRLAS